MGYTTLHYTRLDYTGNKQILCRHQKTRRYVSYVNSLQSWVRSVQCLYMHIQEAGMQTDPFAIRQCKGIRGLRHASVYVPPVPTVQEARWASVPVQTKRKIPWWDRILSMTSSWRIAVPTEPSGPHVSLKYSTKTTAKQNTHYLEDHSMVLLHVSNENIISRYTVLRPCKCHWRSCQDKGGDSCEGTTLPS